MILRWFLLFSLLLGGGSALADIDVYPFEDPKQEERFRRLIEEFRCPKCQNQTLSDSNAPLAKDLRELIYEQIQAGKTDAEIAAFLQQRYGDFVLYNPPLKANTALLWFGPFVALLLVLIFLIRRKMARAKESPSVLTPEEQARLQTLLNEQNKDKA